MSLTSIGDTLADGHQPKKTLRQQVLAAQVLEYAEQAIQAILGPEAAYHAKPLFLKNRTLTISCTRSAVAQEIRLQQTKLVELINEKLGGKEVDRIRYLA